MFLKHGLQRGCRCRVTRLPSRLFCPQEEKYWAVTLVTLGPLINTCTVFSILLHFLFCFFLGGRIDEKAAQLHAITSLQAMLGKQQGSFAGGVNGNNSLTPQGPEVRQTRWNHH